MFLYSSLSVFRGRGRGAPRNEARENPQTYRLNILRGYLKQTIYLPSFASPGRVGGGGGAMVGKPCTYEKPARVGCYQHLLNMVI